MDNTERRDTGGHLDIERMLAWAHGESGAEEATAVLHHGLACRACGDQLAVLLALADSGSVAVPSPGRRRRGVPGFTQSGALAAAAVIVLLVGAALLAPWLRAPEAGDPGAAMPGPTIDVGPLVAPTPAELARLATAEPPAGAMVDFLFDPAVYAEVPPARAGLQMVVEGRYEEAAGELTRMYEVDPMNGETATVLGIALYLNGDDSVRTEGLLRQGQTVPLDDFSHLAAWYLGNLYLRRGDVQQATRALEALAEFPDDPGTRAQALLEQIRGELR